MEIVVARNVVMRIDSFVSLLRSNCGLNMQSIISLKNKMLAFAESYIHQATLRNKPKGKKSQSGYCYYKDGISRYKWVFFFTIYYNQQLVIIHHFGWVNFLQENEAVQKSYLLMEKLNRNSDSDFQGACRTELEEERLRMFIDRDNWLTSKEKEELKKIVPIIKGISIQDACNYFI